MSDPVDIGNRRLALDPSRSFSVRAPAGSGKTELLTQRILVLLARVQRPEEVLSITFTRKAAAEMRDRLLKALQLAQNDQPPESDYQRQTWALARAAMANDQQHNWNLLQNPPRLQIMTIDSLCAGLTRQLPQQSQFGLQPDIAPDATALYQQAVQRLLDQLESDDQLAQPLGQLLLHLDNDIARVEALLISMLARRDQWLPLVGSGDQLRQARPILESALTQLVTDELAALCQQLHPFASQLALAADYAADNLQRDNRDSPVRTCLGLTGLPLADPAEQSLWQGLSELLLKKDGDWRKTVTVANGFPAGKTAVEKESSKARKQGLLALIGELAEQPGLRPRLQRLQLLPEVSYSDSQWQILDALTRVLPNLVAQLWLSFSEQAQVDYPQITAAALQALGDEQQPTDLSLLLDYRISHILVDEFQDTASPQIQLLKKLTYGWHNGDGRTLFIVGDGMQSCYGFRDANVGLFLEARRHGIGDVKLSAADLSVNFRSQQQIVDWVNQIFKASFPAKDDISHGAVSYSDSVAFNPPLDGEAVCLHGLVNYPDSLSRAKAEAHKVVQLVQLSRIQDPRGSIAILVRNRPHLKAILPALRQAGLSWQATDLDPLATRMWVVDLLSLTRALVNPADRIAWLALLRAPWCGLDNADLLAVAGAAALQQPIWQRIEQLATQTGELSELPDGQYIPLSADGLLRIQRLYRVLQQSWQQRQRRSLRDSIELCWLSLGGAAGLDPAQRLDIDKTLGLIEQQDSGGRLQDWQGFERALQRLYAQPASDADSRLQIMTIHKSKGLEFDTVILAGLDRRPPAPDKPLLQWQLRLGSAGHEQLLLAPLAARDKDQDQTYRYLAAEAQEKSRMETTRLLYVGATRAVKRLHLTANLKTDKKDQLTTPNKDCLLAGIWQQVSELFQLTDHQGEDSSASESTTQWPQQLRQLQRLPLDWQPPLPIDESLLPVPSHFEQADNDNLPRPDWLQASRLAGTLVHQILKQVTESGQPPDMMSLKQQQQGWKLQLLQLGLAPADLAQALTRVKRLIANTLDDPQGRWIIDNSHQHSACELPLSYHNGFKTQHYVIDRTFVDSDGARWIIDYKTASCPDELAFDQFITQESERYRQQLQNYANTFASMENRPIRTALYFPESQHLQELRLPA
ncbi:MAG: UvrD-helicase domain-containing protein [Motiliproteus sp.]